MGCDDEYSIRHGKRGSGFHDEPGNEYPFSDYHESYEAAVAREVEERASWLPSDDLGRPAVDAAVRHAQRVEALRRYSPTGRLWRACLPPEPQDVNQLGELVPVGHGSDITTTKVQAMDDLRRALEAVAGITSLLNRFGNQEPVEGTVLKWIKRYDARTGEMLIDAEDGSWDAQERALRFRMSAPKEYVHVAFRAPSGTWYSTGQTGRSTWSWDDLVKEIGDAECEVVTDWTEVPAPEAPDAQVMDPVTWAKMMFGKKSEEKAEDSAE